MPNMKHVWFGLFGQTTKDGCSLQWATLFFLKKNKKKIKNIISHVSLSDLLRASKSLRRIVLLQIKTIFNGTCTSLFLKYQFLHAKWESWMKMRRGSAVASLFERDLGQQRVNPWE